MRGRNFTYQAVQKSGSTSIDLFRVGGLKRITEIIVIYLESDRSGRALIVCLLY